MDVMDNSDVAGHKGSCRKYSGHSGTESSECVFPYLPAPDSSSEALSVQRGSSFDQVSGKVGGFVSGLNGWHGQTMTVLCDRCNCKVWNPEQHERWH